MYFVSVYFFFYFWFTSPTSFHGSCTCKSSWVIQCKDTCVGPLKNPEVLTKTVVKRMKYDIQQPWELWEQVCSHLFQWHWFQCSQLLVCSFSGIIFDPEQQVLKLLNSQAIWSHAQSFLVLMSALLETEDMIPFVRINGFNHAEASSLKKLVIDSS